MSIDFDQYLAAEELATKNSTPYNINSANKEVDASPISSWADLEEVQPFGLGVNINIPNKPNPDDLASAITTREQVGACLYVIKKDANWVVEFFNNSFYLTTFSIALKEKVQIMETFSSAIVSFFGDRIRIYSFGGTALDTLSSDSTKLYKNFQQSGLIHMYNNVIRGTKLVDSNRVAVMAVANHYVYGYPINLSVRYTSASDKLAQFSMDWIVLDHTMTYPYVLQQSDLQNIYKVDSSFKDYKLIDAPMDVNKTIDTVPNIDVTNVA